LAGLKTKTDSFVSEVTSVIINSGMPHLDCFSLEDGIDTFDRKVNDVLSTNTSLYPRGRRYQLQCCRSL